MASDVDSQLRQGHSRNGRHLGHQRLSTRSRVMCRRSNGPAAWARRLIPSRQLGSRSEKRAAEGAADP